MNFDVSIFIITADRQYIPANEYDDCIDGEGVFVMLTNDEMNMDFGDDNSICIYKEWVNAVNETKDRLGDLINSDNRLKFVRCPWQVEWQEIPNTFKLNEKTDDIGMYGTESRNGCMRRYLDGNGTNREIMRNVLPLLRGRTLEEYIPAIMMAYHTKIVFDGRTLHGYLPAIGQLLFISKNISMINMTLGKISGNVKLFTNYGEKWQLGNQYWSAMEAEPAAAWSMGADSMLISGKQELSLILPLFSI